MDGSSISIFAHDLVTVSVAKKVEQTSGPILFWSNFRHRKGKELSHKVVARLVAPDVVMSLFLNVSDLKLLNAGKHKAIVWQSLSLSPQSLIDRW